MPGAAANQVPRARPGSLQSRSGSLNAFESLSRRVPDGGEMPHLASLARRVLSIEKKTRALDFECARECRRPPFEPQVAQQVDDRARTRRPHVAEREDPPGAHELL